MKQVTNDKYINSQDAINSIFLKLQDRKFFIDNFIQTATFKASIKCETIHHHLYLPKDYSGSPTTSIYTPWTEAEVLAHLATGWGEGAITELKLEYLYGPEPEVSGE